MFRRARAASLCAKSIAAQALSGSRARCAQDLSPRRSAHELRAGSPCLLSFFATRPAIAIAYASESTSAVQLLPASRRSSRANSLMMANLAPSSIYVLCSDDLDLIDERLKEVGMALALRKKVTKAVRQRLYFDEPGWEFEEIDYPLH